MKTVDILMEMNVPETYAECVKSQCNFCAYHRCDNGCPHKLVLKGIHMQEKDIK